MKKQRMLYNLICIIMLLITMTSGICAAKYKADSFFEYIESRENDLGKEASVKSRINEFLEQNSRENTEVINEQNQSSLFVENRRTNSKETNKISLIQLAAAQKIELVLLIMAAVLLKTKKIRRSNDAIIKFIHNQAGGKTDYYKLFTDCAVA